MMIFSRRLGRAALVAATAAMLCPSARADEQTVKLIRLLIAKGILTQSQAGELLRESGPTPAMHARHGARQAPGELPAEEAAVPAPGHEHDIRVTYVPQFIRRQIADQVRAQVMSEAQQEGWAAPDALPEWTRRVKLYGDMRFREEGDLFDSNNANQNVRNYNQFINFNAINNGSPFDDQSLTGLPPYLNTTEDRNRFRVRARIGTLVDIDEGVLANFRLSTGSDFGPVTPNQVLGQPGDFSKYAVYLDRAYLQLDPAKPVTFMLGRTPNPFFTTDLLFWSELGFDGISALYHQNVGGGVEAFATGGAYPIFNTDFNFSTFSAEKFRSTDAYLFAIQGGAKWHVTPNLLGLLGIGLFNFNGVQGAVSKPCYNLLGTTTPPVYACNTDDTRTPYDIFGNTMYRIRNLIQPPPVNGVPTTLYDPQYYGLAARFNVLDVHPRFDILTYHPFDISLEGDFIKNLGFNANAIAHHGPFIGLTATGAALGVGPVNNLGATSNPALPGPFVGGDTGYMVKATVGNLQVHKLWDWNVVAGYKYLESDATLDSLTDPDFHLGGTNAQGYILAASLGVARDTFLNLRWFSAQTIAGPHYGNDVIQLDLQASY